MDCINDFAEIWHPSVNCRYQQLLGLPKRSSSGLDWNCAHRQEQSRPSDPSDQTEPESPTGRNGSQPEEGHPHRRRCGYFCCFLFFVFVSTFFARLITDTGNNFMDDGRWHHVPNFLFGRNPRQRVDHSGSADLDGQRTRGECRLLRLHFGPFWLVFRTHGQSGWLRVFARRRPDVA